MRHSQAEEAIKKCVAQQGLVEWGVQGDFCHLKERGNNTARVRISPASSVLARPCHALALPGAPQVWSEKSLLIQSVSIQ